MSEMGLVLFVVVVVALIAGLVQFWSQEDHPVITEQDLDEILTTLNKLDNDINDINTTQ